MAARRVRETDGHKWPLPNRLLTEASLACWFVRLFPRPSLVARMNLVHVADAIPSLRLSPLLLPYRLVRYSNPIWRLIEQASEHEDLFDDVISNHIFPNDVAGSPGARFLL